MLSSFGRKLTITIKFENCYQFVIRLWFPNLVHKLLPEMLLLLTGFFRLQLKPQVLSLCSRVSSLAVTSAKERLCQSEISKKIAHILRAVLSLEGETSSSGIMAHYLGQLPLPDDYELQELRNLNRSYMRETMETH